jgi:hypothetical protein
MHQHLLDAAHHLRGYDCRLPCVNRSSGMQVYRHLLLLALHHLRGHGFNGRRLCGFTTAATCRQYWKDGRKNGK